ncbi:hypothetical protein Dsin_013622 [Dipteronia sinensis]|uniref:Uncharacterized protein n=1 Tax=Dipteronia sinensis TaxID=43782 RepID=A0AAE0E9L8_9ROSI|nr:hypothetical protein Dsin_013622 [Dipteronia sinensis]
MNKRCVFLEHAVSLTGLSNIQVVRGRAEDLGHNLSFREQFDVAVARAVAEMRILAEYCLSLVRVGGLFVVAKGHAPQVVESGGKNIEVTEIEEAEIDAIVTEIEAEKAAAAEAAKKSPQKET